MIALVHVLRRMFRIRYYEHDTAHEVYDADKLSNLLHKVRRPWWRKVL